MILKHFLLCVKVSYFLVPSNLNHRTPFHTTPPQEGICMTLKPEFRFVKLSYLHVP